jgi:hypothetical protein
MLPHESQWGDHFGPASKFDSEDGLQLEASIIMGWGIIAQGTFSFSQFSLFHSFQSICLSNSLPFDRNPIVHHIENIFAHRPSSPAQLHDNYPLDSVNHNARIRTPQLSDENRHLLHPTSRISAAATYGGSWKW